MQDRAFWAEKHEGSWFIMYQGLRHMPREEWPNPVRLLKYHPAHVTEETQQFACTRLAAILDAAHPMPESGGEG